MSCTLKKQSLLEGLPYDDLEALNKKRYTVNYVKGEVICKAGAKPLGLICLNEGKVKITMRGVNGVEQIVSLKKSVDFIGFNALMRDDVCLSSAIALGDVSVCVIEKEDFFSIVKKNSELAFKIIRFLAEEVVRLDARIVNLTQKHVQARLAEALLIINDIYGTTTSGNLAVSLKRADLGALSNMTATNTSRVLSSFAKEKIIELHQKEIKIVNLKALQDLSTVGF